MQLEMPKALSLTTTISKIEAIFFSRGGQDCEMIIISRKIIYDVTLDLGR